MLVLLLVTIRQGIGAAAKTQESTRRGEPDYSSGQDSSKAAKATTGTVGCFNKNFFEVASGLGVQRMRFHEKGYRKKFITFYIV